MNTDAEILVKLREAIDALAEAGSLFEHAGADRDTLIEVNRIVIDTCKLSMAIRANGVPHE
jgi:hypothetical protein